MANSMRDLAKQLADLDRRIRTKGSTSQLAYSSIESGAINAYEGDSHTMAIGRQWDGTYTSSVVNGPTPPTPTTPYGFDGSNGGSVRWDGGFLDGAVVPMDFLRVDIHLSQTDGFTADFENRYGTIVAPTGGEVAFSLAPGTWYAVLVVWTQAGAFAVSGQTTFESNEISAVASDGLAPASSPNPEVLAGIQEMYVRWTAIANADPVWYDIHVSTTLGFTPDSTTKVGETQASAFTIRALPGDPPAEGEEDTRLLQYDTAYYVRIVARDEDGSAAPSAQAVGAVFQVTGINLAVDSVAAQHIATGSLTGDKFSATVIYAGTFKTAEAGQRVETGIAGIQGYKSDGSLMINFPTDPDQTALIDAEIIARGLTVTNGMVLRATSTIEPDGVLKLGRGIAPPISTPQMSTDYLKRYPWTGTLTDAQKTGPLGTFDLVPTEVSCIEWKEDVDNWVIHQIRPNGTRAWFFDFDGNPTAWAGPAYFTDYVNWEIHSVVNITTSTTAKNGVYRMARWIPSGTNNTYYLMCPQGSGFNRYSRQNGTCAPVVGTNGTDVFVAEVINSNQLQIRYFTPNGDQNNLSAPIATYASAAGFNASHQLGVVTYDGAGFDTGTGVGRYVVSERGYTTKNKLVYTSGSGAGSIHPGGVAAGASSWTSPNIDAETFEAASASPRAVAWMPSEVAFWTYSGDGYLYEHTGVFWDPATTSSTIWAQHSFYDSVATTHETIPGPAKSFTWPRRSRILMSMPPIPGSGGTDEPNQVRTYMGRGATQPTNSNMWLQVSTSQPSVAIDDVPLLGSNPLTVSTFPNTNPGKVQSDDGSMIISGDGTITIGGKQVALGAPTVTYYANSTSWTKPAGLKAAFVEIWGGGAGSGGAIAVVSGGPAQVETGAGGSGSYSAKWYLASDLSATESLTVGTGGNGGSTAGSNGTNGGSTVWKGMTAGPGLGGSGVTARTSTQLTGAAAGGAGGTSTGGDINIPGAPGGNGRWLSGAAILAARGGDTIMGRGGMPGTGAGTYPGTGYGSGAGGTFAGGTALGGAAGQGGLCKITCYF